MFPPARPLAVGIAALGLGLGMPAGAAESTGDSAGAGGLTITPPSLLVPAEQAAPASAPTSHERIRQLEQQVQRMAADARTQQEVVRTLRRRLATAESASQWVPLFGTALGALIIVAGYLGVQLHRISNQRRREREQARLQRLIDAHDDAVPGVRSPVPIAATAALVRTAAPQRAEPAAAAPQEVTAALEPNQDGIGAAAQRAVSVEEMLDLEQQADFFLALGQDEAAIDLLMGHIRASGGASPLPYLKLLEIYRRRGDEPSFERTRKRFSLRFNAVVPAFADDLDRGRDLEHYPQVMRRVQKVWANPLDALAELESLLYRHDDAEPFDLPAYRDLLLLAAVANDLRVAAGAPVTSVDLLLPLGEGAAEPSQTVRRALASRLAGTQAMAPELTSHLLGRRDDDRAGEPVDLDLSDVGAPPREFTRPAAFSDVEMREDRHPTGLGALEDLDPSARQRRR
jgi:pilus assembly protein FimV